jgi:hypothetical protein
MPKQKRLRKGVHDEWPDAITAQSLGPAFGVTRQAVGQWFKAGCPRLPDGRYRLADVWAWRLEQERGKACEGGWEEEGQKWRALKHKHQLEALQGRYVETSTVAAFWQDRCLEARAAMQAIGQALAPQCVGLDAQQIRDLLDDSLRRVCEGLARTWEAALDAGDNDKAA